MPQSEIERISVAPAVEEARDLTFAGSDLIIEFGCAHRFAEKFAAAMDTVPYASRWTTQRVRDIVSEHEDGSLAILDRSSKELIGFAFVYLVADFNEFMFPGPSLVLRRLFVRPSHRSLGMGSLLFHRAVGGPRPTTWQTSTEATDAIAWFGRRGVEPIGSITNGARADYIYRVPGRE
ncbi:GNAT family N-acetyltransferase [Nostocoides vanveenii]|uniref:N-acetyltransferase domain-containing protein n=1 Tax=Nostocoides vanveenii TaxID=330835 RepID=A0ABN2K0D1_9MICO